MRFLSQIGRGGTLESGIFKAIGIQEPSYVGTQVLARALGVNYSFSE